MDKTSAANWEDVADLLPPGYEPPLRSMADPAQAVGRMGRYLRRRLEAITDEMPGRPTLMLSGGVDSIVLAAQLKDLRLDPLCVTICAKGHKSTDRAPAAVASSLGLDHYPVELSRADIARLSRRAVELLGVDELWEIGAAVHLLAVDEAVSAIDGPVITGGGGDVLLAGGIRLSAPIGSLSAAAELRAAIWANLQKSFRRVRLVPDFYERLTEERHVRYFKAYQTVEAWDATSDFAPEVLFGLDADGALTDKMCLRDLAVELLGVPPRYVWVKKVPMQISSGITASFVDCARHGLSQDTTQLAYTDPRTEDLQAVASRLWLKSLTEPQAAQSDVHN